MEKEKLLKFVWGVLPIIIVLALGGMAVLLANRVQQKKTWLKTQKNNSIKVEQPLVKVIALEIQAKVIEDRLNLPGIVYPWEDLLVQAQVSGQIIAVPVEEGDMVQSGQVLARLDRRDYENRLAQAEAAYNLAEADYERLSKLWPMKAASAAQVEAGLARLKETKANRSSARLDLERTTITAPISGYINRLDATTGLLADRSTHIAQILNTQKVKVEVGIPESDIRAIQGLKTAWMTVEALGEEKFLGRKIFMARQPDPSSRVYNLKLAVDNPAGNLQPGMFTRVELVKHRYQSAVSIPLYAVIARSDERFVYILNGDTAHYRKVELGVLDGWQVQITGGVKAGDRVIIVGHRSLEDEQKVQVQKIVHDPDELVE